MLAGRSPFDIAGASDIPDQNTEDYLFQVILEKTIRIPRSLSVKAASVLKGFLNKNPADRLGCHRDTGFYDIANHPFFKSIDWEPVICSISLFIILRNDTPMLFLNRAIMWNNSFKYSTPVVNSVLVFTEWYFFNITTFPVR